MFRATQLIAAALLFTPLLTPGQATQDAQPQFNIYAVREVQDDQPGTAAASLFDCNDRIHVVVEASGLAPELHTLTVQWINPQGASQERTEYQFHGLPDTRIWAWLQLSGPIGSAIGQIFDPSFGMEEFIGEWQAKVFIDKQKIQEIKFDVLC